MTAVSGCLNPAARRHAGTRGLFDDAEYEDVATFFGSRPDLRPTPLRRLDHLAAALGVASLHVKDESARFGLDAFKIAGVLYAVDRLLRERDASTRETTIVAASTGNHGRAVARAARGRGLPARVYLPAGTVARRVEAIRREGAVTVVIDGPYEEAVATAASDAAREGWLFVSDTALSSRDTKGPRRVMAGYTWIVSEAARQWPPDAPPTLVLVQAGVGGLTAAVASWFAQRMGDRRPAIIAAEPTGAACLQASIGQGSPAALQGPLGTALAGLACASPSAAAWPALRDLVDGCIAVPDTAALDAMVRLACPIPPDPAIAAGPSGACGLACLIALAGDATLAPVRAAVGLGPDARVLVFNTEGDTDPELRGKVLV